MANISFLDLIQPIKKKEEPSLDIPRNIGIPTFLDMTSTAKVPSIISKTKEEEANKKENILWTLLEQTQRPLYAIANPLYQAMVNKDYGVAKNIWAGFTLEEKKSFGDTLRDVVQPESKLGKTAVAIGGLGLDIFLDPLTYTGVGLAGKAGQVVKAGTKASKMIKAGRAAGKALETKRTLTFAGKVIPKSEKIIEPIARGLTRTGRAIREDIPIISDVLDKIKFVSTKFKPKGVDPVVWQKFLDVKQEAINVQKNLELNSIEKTREIAKIFKKGKVTLDDISDITKKIERQEPIVSEISKNIPFKTTEEAIGFAKKEPLAVKSFAKKIEPGLRKEVETGLDIVQKLPKAERAKKFAELSKKATEAQLIREAAEAIAPESLKKAQALKTGGKIAKDFSESLSKKYKNVGETGKKIIQEEGYQYLPHVLENKPVIKKALGFGSKQFTTKSPSDIARTLVKYTRNGDDFILNKKNNRLFKNGGVVDVLKKADIDKTKIGQASIEEINKALGGKVLSSNLPVLVGVQGHRTAKVVGGDTFFKKVLPLGKTKEQALKIQKSTGRVFEEAAAPELKGKFFDPEIKRHVDATYKKLTEPEEIAKIVEIFDKVQNTWKSWATYWNIPFHTRNAISNTQQNSLAGVNNPLDYIKAAKIQRKAKFNQASLSGDEKQILKEFNKQGLARTGWLSGDIKKDVSSELMGIFDFVKEQEKTAGKVLEIAKTPFRTINRVGGNIGNAVENNAKLAHFIAKRKDGMSAFDAGQSVKKYLFDYEDLTDAERKILKRVLPFYTWTRKNIPLQLEALIKTPAKQAKILKIKRNIEVLTGSDETEALLPEWIKKSAPVFVGKKDGKARYINLEGFLPVADINKLTEPAKNLINMVTPLLKVPLEQSLNHNFFFGSKITQQEGLKGIIPREIAPEIGGIGERDLIGRIPGRLEHLARLFRPISEIDKVIGRKHLSDPAYKKLMNVLLGGKIYEYDTRKLLRSFDYLNEDEARGIQRQINILRKEGREKPEVQERNFEDIKLLKTLLIKSKREARLKRIKARKGI
jgi:hypothetical protein